MLGFNGGLLGKRRVPSIGVTSGLWFPNEQSVARRDALWPTTDDPYFANVSLLLHMNGSNGSTTFTDNSANAFTVTANGNAQISTSAPKYGSGSLLLDGSGDYLTLPADNQFQLGLGDFTVECWVNLGAGNSNNGLFTFGGTSSGLFIAAYIGNWHLGFFGQGGTLMGPFTIGLWQHLAVTRSGTSFRLFLDGQQLGSTLGGVYNFTDDQLKIGYYFSSQYAINGFIDEFRVTKGIARYTANFTPPTTPFPNA